ncbi:MAG: 2'-5' RNA ligase [Gammaproteobacteria bacterium]
MARLFFALRPDRQVRAEIQTFADALSLESARLVAAKNTHITLAFLGSVDELTRRCLIKGASLLRIPPFTLSLDNLGWWRKPKIAWLAPSTFPDELSELAADLQHLSEDCGLNLEKRPYLPHLTLARKVTSPISSTHVDPISWNINEFCLLESIAGENGVEYQVKVSWPLKIM